MQAAVAAQVARGEEPDIAAAESEIQDWFAVQQMWAYFGGVYFRRATPEDMYLAKLSGDAATGALSDKEFDALPDNVKQVMRLWSMRG